MSGGGRVDYSQCPDPGPVIKLQTKGFSLRLILMLPLIAVKKCWVSVIPRKVMVMKKRGRGGRIGSSEGRSERVSDEWKQSPHWGCRNMAGNELMHIVSFCMSWPTWFNLFWRAGKRKSKRERERMKHKRDLLYIQIKFKSDGFNSSLVKIKPEACNFFMLTYFILFQI